VTAARARLTFNCSNRTVNHGGLVDELEAELLQKLSIVNRPISLAGAFQGLDVPVWALDAIERLTAAGLVVELTDDAIELTPAGQARLAALPVPNHAPDPVRPIDRRRVFETMSGTDRYL
jgi:hypothetical protein